MSTSLLAVDQMLESLKRFYIPSETANAMLLGKANTDSVAAIMANCNVDKLINTITKAIGEGASTSIARIGGGMLWEIPDQYDRFMNAPSNINIYKFYHFNYS